MKNLVVTAHENYIINKNKLLKCDEYLCCYDFDKNQYYFLNIHEKCLLILNADNSETVQIISLNSNEYHNAQSVGMEYCSTNEKVYCIFDTGILAQFTQDNESKIVIENVAYFEKGLLSMSISPDHEMFVLLTKDFNVISVSAEIDILSECNLISTSFGEKAFVNVGWGKKETQFHGSDGKNAAKVKNNNPGKTESDNGLPKITWKGDGSMYAISLIDPTENIRKLKIFNRDGILQYTSEFVGGLEDSLAWKPSGNIIACARKLPNKQTIALFEKNGLLHREFSISQDPKNTKIHNILWSRDSDVLVIWSEDLLTKTMSVGLWAEKNYHWYLKQIITYTNENPVLHATWSPNTDKDLIILSTRSISMYTFHWEVISSRGKVESDKAVVAVIDGYKIQITKFREAIVPPPMAQQTLQFNEPVNAVCFAPPTESLNHDAVTNNFIGILNNNEVVFCKYIDNETTHSHYEHRKTYRIKWEDENVISNSTNSFFLHHILWFKPDILLCSLSKNNQNWLAALFFEGSSNLEECEIVGKVIKSFKGEIDHILPSKSLNNAYVTLNNEFHIITQNNSSQELNVNEVVGEIYPEKMKDIIKSEFIEVNEKPINVALSKKNILSVNGKQVANNVTSFATHSDFLLLTTLQHSLLSFKLDDKDFEKLSSKDLTIQPWETGSKSQSTDFHIRRVERGSVLITAVPKDNRVILQMPRGNLECIQPRSLSIAIIGSYIDELNYYKAFDLIRKQRIDLNLIVDHSPSKFLNNIEMFVTEISKPDWLSLFLSELKSEDVTKTTYMSSYTGRYPAENDTLCFENPQNKVIEVCSSLRTVMEKNHDTFIQPILISLVKNQERVGLENALKKVKQLLLVNRSSDCGQKLVTAEEALNYLLHVVDVNILFNTALGLYDFELTMFVAEKSQKDPKEYVPFLNELKNLEENYMKYSIDKHLKRYSSALVHLSACTDKFDEFINFTKEHELYSKAITLFKLQSKEYKTVTEVYGEFLMSKTKYQEAGIMFTKSGNYREALDAFSYGLNWPDVILTTQKLKLSFQECYDIYRDLVKRLEKENRHQEASTILLRYLNMPEDAIATLCEGKKWYQAWYSAQYIDRQDIIETHVTPGVLEHVLSLMNTISENQQNFTKYKDRLKTVRAELAVKNLQCAETDFSNEFPNRDVSDLLSETTSIAGSTVTRSSQVSRTTGRTYKSSKNRRKQERKLNSIKEGSIYEDLALLTALHDIVTKTYEQRSEIRNLAEILFHLNREDHTEKLYTAMHSCLTEISKYKFEIWNTNHTKPYLCLPDESDPTACRIPNFINSKIFHLPEEKTMDWIFHTFKYIFN